MYNYYLVNSQYKECKIKYLGLLLEARPLLFSVHDPFVFVSLDGDDKGDLSFSLLFTDVVTVELDDSVDEAEDGGGNVFGLTGYL